MKNSYIINKTYEINELQYYILYFHVRYHFIIHDGRPALKIRIVWTTHDSDVRTRPQDTWLNQSQATLSWDNHMSLEMRGHWQCPGTCPGHVHLRSLVSCGVGFQQNLGKKSVMDPSCQHNFWGHQQPQGHNKQESTTFILPYGSNKQHCMDKEEFCWVFFGVLWGWFSAKLG
jgi:hypothetical protein